MTPSAIQILSLSCEMETMCDTYMAVSLLTY
ncbi:hypothetical protein M6B38_332545 [Iris pallida]|uniref:Uncharacterized protein n=1 Tax=Iris pallida TaxID=29817 RepID=A0AAX6H4S0_IRIPA|nr:hypothetical protein M6B38_332545 [Iris pallida]